MVPGSKTVESAGTAEVEVELWPWIESAIPAPVQYEQLDRHWHFSKPATALRLERKAV